MSQTQLKFQYKLRPKNEKLRNYRDVQRSVNVLFGILEEYGRLEKLEANN